MRTTLKIAFRNTSRQKKRTILLAGAIAFGVMVITLASAFSAGMADSVKMNISRILGGHIFITGSELTSTMRIVNRIGDDEALEAALSEVEGLVARVNRRSTAFANLIFGSRQTVQRVDGVDLTNEADLLKALKVAGGSLNGVRERNFIILPALTAEKLDVRPGETILAKTTTVTGQQNVGEFLVAAVIEDQGTFGITTAYGGLDYINELTGLKPHEYHTVQVLLTRMESMDEVADRICGVLAERAEVEPRLDRIRSLDPDEDSDRGAGAVIGFMGGTASLAEGTKPWTGTKFSVTTLNDMMQPVQQVVRVLDTIGLVVFMILLTITMVGIMNTFRMVLMERTREIGTMRALGMQRGGVRNIFLLEAVLIGVGGALAGLALAGLIMLILSRISFDHIQALAFFLNNGRLAFIISPGKVVTNLLIVVGITAFAAYLPARAAARLHPAKALGSHF
jgi:putative ABC transport system permease protein